MTGTGRRLCPECGAWNPADSTKCRDCGALFEKDEIVDTVTGFPIPVLHMTDAKTGEEFIVTEAEARIGQDEPFANSFFSAHRRVSHTHCRIFYENGRWQIAEFEGMPSKNETWLRRVRREEPYRVRSIPQLLFDGSVVYIADCEFNIHIDSLPKSETEPKDAPHKETDGSLSKKDTGNAQEDLSPKVGSQPVWTIICPVCGKEYIVEGPQSRIRTCESCDDPFDRIRIAEIRPSRKE